MNEHSRQFLLKWRSEFWTGKMDKAEIAVAPSRGRDLERLNAIARLLDDCIPVPGTKMRFGLDGIVGLFPGFGDLLTALLGVYLIASASRMGLPRTALVRMAGNTGVDLVIGAVPVLGDIFDFVFKANRRNVELVRTHLAIPEAASAPGGYARK